MTIKRPKEVRWLKAALDDLSEIVDYISKDNPRAAEWFSDRIFAKVEMLAQQPGLGSICPYYPKARQLVHGNYLIYYTIHRHEVVIRAVVHGARLFQASWITA